MNSSSFKFIPSSSISTNKGVNTCSKSDGKLEMSILYAEIYPSPSESSWPKMAEKFYIFAFSTSLLVCLFEWFLDASNFFCFCSSRLSESFRSRLFKASWYNFSPGFWFFSLARPLGALPTWGWNRACPVSGSKSSLVRLLEFSMSILDRSWLLLSLWLNLS